ncbi:hypothetical protein DYB37_012582, partial [Aphanomyces astaci]
MKLVLGLDGAGKTMLLRQLSHTCKDEFHNPKLGSDFEKVRIRLFTDSASVAEVDGIDVATLPTTGCQKTVEKVGVQNRVDADFGARAAVHGGGAWIFRQTEKLMMRSLCRSSSYDGVSEHIEPDESFGPARNIGAVRPANHTWGEFHTLKIDVDVSRGWALLDPKAILWATFPGVAYI